MQLLLNGTCDTEAEGSVAAGTRPGTTSVVNWGCHYPLIDGGAFV